MTIAIIAAMEEELACIRDKMLNRQETKIGELLFYQGQHGNHSIVVTLCGVGKVAAAMTTALLSSHFSAECIIVTGLSGSLSPNLKIGDVVIADQGIYHDVDARPNFPRYQIPFGETIFHANQDLVDKSLKAVAVFQKNIREHIQQSDLEAFDIKQPRYIMGAIATGDQFIVKPEQLMDIRGDITRETGINVVAIDMESTAVMDAARKCGKKAVALRVISDGGDNIDYKRFKHTIAGQYTAGIIDVLLNYLDCHDAPKSILPVMQHVSSANVQSDASEAAC